MTTPPALYSVALHEAGERLIGPDWPAAVARLTGVNARTLQRVRDAAREGREYPAARGALAALAEAVEGLAGELAQFKRS